MPSPSTLSACLAALPFLSSALPAQSLDLPQTPGGFVSVPASAALVPQTGITLEAWVRPTLLAGRPTVIRKNPTAFNESYVLRIEFNRPQFSVRTAAGFFTLWPNHTVSAGAHTHLAATYDGTTMRLFDHGALIGESVVSGGPLLDTGGELRIGKGDDVSSGEAFVGGLDAVRVWDHARQPHQIWDGLDRELPFGNGLVASWNFDNDFVDEAGGNDGSPSGSPGFAGEFTYFTQGIDLSQSGAGYVEVPDAPELVPATGLTVEAWIEITNYGIRPTILRKDVTGFGESYNFRLESGRLQLIVRTASGIQRVWAPGLLPLNTPMHVAGTYDGATMALYRDGVQIDSRPVPLESIAPSTGALRIGSGGPAEPFLGRIDSVRLWSVGLQESDIRRLRDREAERIPGMIASWSFHGNYDDSTGTHHGTAVGGPVPFCEQFGDQTAVIDPGLSNFGAGYLSCGRVPQMYAGSVPELGNADFAIGSSGGPANGMGMLVLSLGRLNTPTRLLGTDVWIDTQQVLDWSLAGATPLGQSRRALPIPSTASFIGFEVFAQTAWFDACGSAGLTTSDGLRFRVVN